MTNMENWGSISVRLTASPGEIARLTPQEWTSGDIHRVVEAIGDERAVKAALERLRTKEWRGKGGAR